MRINVKAKPRAKKEEIIPPQAGLFADREEVYIVSIKEPPVDGKANEAIVRVLAEYFKVPKSHVRIVSGQTSKKKIVEILGGTLFIEGD
jgi:uncharacterized protein (TIGR00251 family)